MYLKKGELFIQHITQTTCLLHTCTFDQLLIYIKQITHYIILLPIYWEKFTEGHPSPNSSLMFFPECQILSSIKLFLLISFNPQCYLRKLFSWQISILTQTRISCCHHECVKEMNFKCNVHNKRYFYSILMKGGYFHIEFALGCKKNKAILFFQSLAF